MSTAPEVKPDSIIRISANLMAAGLLSAVVLAILNFFTQPLREANERERFERGRQEALQGKAVRFEELEAKEQAEAEGDGHESEVTRYRGFDEHGDVVGYVIANKCRGYEGHIEYLLGVGVVTEEDQADRLAIVEFTLVKQRETPGLGDNAKQPWFRERFAGHDATQLEVQKVVADGEKDQKIEAITGATITSRALANAFKADLEQLAELLGE
jgi:electron transport complex protein RnfG